MKHVGLILTHGIIVHENGRYPNRRHGLKNSGAGAVRGTCTEGQEKNPDRLREAVTECTARQPVACAVERDDARMQRLRTMNYERESGIQADQWALETHYYIIIPCCSVVKNETSASLPGPLRGVGSTPCTMGLYWCLMITLCVELV